MKNIVVCLGRPWGLIVLIMIFSLLASPVMAADEIKKAGEYSGLSEYVQKCKQSRGVTGYCREIAIRTEDGKVVGSRINLDTAINHPDGIYFDRNEGDSPSGSETGQIKEIDKVVRERLKPHTKVSMEVHCRQQAGSCAVSQLIVESQ